MNTKNIDQIDKKDNITEILREIISSDLMTKFVKTPIGKLLVTPQNRSYWIKNNPPDALCTGYALRCFEEQEAGSLSVEKAYPHDVLRLGMWAENCFHFFGIDSSGSLLVIRYWDRVHPTRLTTFSHSTLTRKVVNLSNYRDLIITNDDEKTDIELHMKKDKLLHQEECLWQFKVQLRPHVVRSFGYFIEFPQGISSDSVNRWMWANAAVPVENLRIILCVPAHVVKREPSWASFAYNSETQVLIKELETNDNFINDLEKPDFLAELNPWLQIGRTQRFLGGDLPLPKKLMNFLNRKNIPLIGDQNTFFVDFNLVNPLTYQMVVFQVNR